MKSIFANCLLLSFVFAMSNSTIAQLPHSFARPDEVSIKHLHLDLNVDFVSKKLSGSATLTLDRNNNHDALRLDTERLDIVDVKTVDGRALEWKLGERKAQLGKMLSIDLAGSDKVVINYSTRPSAEALQWLDAEQTTDKKHPFLFTQSQAILARTWVPCQDTPAVRMTYSAKIRVPEQLMAVMSASNPQAKNDSGVYEFEMKQPIPSYLLALAVGDLKFKSLGPRSGVYSEPSVLAKAVWEMHDTERMISAAEELYGPYRWDRYDVIFLPSSFPFGGMENPRLTFATPTILAGDRSLVALIAHELAHSWSGNLVTNATWNDFWLNEGFTVYFEQRIMEAIYGREYSEMLAKLSLDGLKAEIKEMDERDTWLKLDLLGRNPDDGMSAIAYDKGYFFLRMLEDDIGRENWDTFLKTYFDKFAFKSMTTEGFVEYLEANLEASVDVKKWIYGPGLPDNCPIVKTGELEQVKMQVGEFQKGTPADELDTTDWTTHHWLHFLRSLDGLTTEQMQELDSAFEFTASGNSEITHDWCLHVIDANYEPAMSRVEQFLTEQGRRKFLQPLYEKLAETNDGKKRARDIYTKARAGYHAVSRMTIDEILDVKNDAGPWKELNTGVTASLRGLCVVDANTIWASGSGGTVVLSEDAGATWLNVSIGEAAELDFRDVHAFDSKKAVVLSAGQPARVYQTVDGGENWELRFEHPDKKSFFDAVSFWDHKHGIAMSDPVDDRLLLIETKDGGATWKELDSSRRPLVERGEAGFAASGSNMCVVYLDSVYIALGGAEEGQSESASRIVYSHNRGRTWSSANVPVPRSQGGGVFSVAFADDQDGIAVGGDYLNPENAKGNIAITTDAGKTWAVPKGTPPRGYRSGVSVRETESGTIWVAVGPGGTDVSIDGGQNWKAATDVGFHAVRMSPNYGFASGSEGRVAKWVGQ